MKLFSIKQNVMFAIAGALAFFAVPAGIALAYTFNTYSNDCPTVMVTRVGNSPTSGFGCWNTSDTASDGDEVSFAVYYHNTGAQAVSGVSVYLANPSATDSSSVTLSGGIKVNGVVVKTGSATVNFNGARGHLVPVRATHELNGGANRTTIQYNQVLSGGYSAGTVQPAWASQGVVKVVFRVEAENIVVPTNRPDVETLPETNVGNDSATLEGRANPKGSATEAWFIYGKGNLNSSTSEVSIGSGNSFVPFDHTLSNLSSGTYEYQACARHTSGFTVVCDTTEYFTIGGVNPSDDDLVVATLNPDIDEDTNEAELRGEVVTLGDGADYADVWFEWGEGDSVSDLDNDVAGDPDTVDSDGENFTATIDDLEDGQEYAYRACAENDENETDCGSLEVFTFHDGGNSDLNVTTDSATNITRTSATLRGEIETGDHDVDECWFEYGTDNDVDDLDDEKNFNCSIRDDDSDDVSATVFGLDQDEKYYYRLCAEDEDNNEDCGSIKSFTTDEDFVVENNLPSIQTLSVIARGGTYASVDGYYSANGCAVSTWFEYGRTTSLGSRTSAVNQTSDFGSMAQVIPGLSPNTTYYYRAVGQNCEGSAYGSILSFTTSGSTIIEPPKIITGGGSSFIKLLITNNEDVVSAGEDLKYEVSWENISGRTLKNLVLEVALPNSLRIEDIEDGDLDRESNSVIIEIDELAPGEDGETEIEVCVRRFKLRDGEPVVARAIMAFENPTTGASLQAIAYDSDIFEGSVASFMPNSLLGWLIVILLIVIIVLFVRSLLKKNDGGSTPAPTNGDYVPYHPTPKV